MTNAVKTFEDAQIVSAADAPMVAMIERIAMDPSVPIERLEQMMAMKERMEAALNIKIKVDPHKAAETSSFIYGLMLALQVRI